MKAIELLPLIDPALHPKYSPNLHAWIKKNWKGLAPRVVVTNPINEYNTRYVGLFHDDDGWLSGTRLMSVLGDGGKAKVWAICPPHSIDETFWDRYIADGRCAIDQNHDKRFIDDGTRWLITPAKHSHRSRTPETRECQWCGHHVEVKLTWTETIQKSEWVAA